jgi:predicted dinucleotide-binding enzyme
MASGKRIAVLGSGDVGRRFGAGLLALKAGYHVTLAAREATNPKIVEWAAEVSAGHSWWEGGARGSGRGSTQCAERWHPRWVARLTAAPPSQHALSRQAARTYGAEHVGTGTFGDAARGADVVFLATLGSATVEMLTSVGADAFAGKVVVDATNPLVFGSSGLPTLFVGHTDSLGEGHWGPGATWGA